MTAAVYLISGGERGPVKVGVAENAQKRLAQLQTAHPYKLKLLKIVEFADRETAYFVERNLHEGFQEEGVERLHGEWFLLSEEMAEDLFTMSVAWFDHHFNDLGWHPRQRKEVRHGLN